MASSHTSPITASTHKTMLFMSQVTAVFCLISVFSCCSSAYELQDTIHTLKEENLHLQHRLENVTRALRDLKHLLTEKSRASGGEYDSAYVHAWREWSQHGISTDTHKMLEQALCLSELHGAAPSIFISPGSLNLLFFLSPLVCAMLPLLS